jgi:3-methyladenine DNA glycosylase AlkD
MPTKQSELSPYDYYEFLREYYLSIGNLTIADGQVAYMKNHFDFFGIKAPVWQAFLKKTFVEKGCFSGEKLMDFVTFCFEDDRRELHYAAIEMVQKVIKQQDIAFVDFITFMLTKNAWWDSVDWIATKIVSAHFKHFPQLIVPTTEKWILSDDFWLQRTSIIFQLPYKNETDFELLKKYILMVADSKEFFLQKGAGWALRDYSRRNPQGVKDFVAANPQLSNLTKREALRLLEK